jgi:hypothetical protein
MHRWCGATCGMWCDMLPIVGRQPTAWAGAAKSVQPQSPTRPKFAASRCVSGLLAKLLGSSPAAHLDGLGAVLLQAPGPKDGRHQLYLGRAGLGFGQGLVTGRQAGSGSSPRHPAAAKWIVHGNCSCQWVQGLQVLVTSRCSRWFYEWRQQQCPYPLSKKRMRCDVD